MKVRDQKGHVLIQIASLLHSLSFVMLFYPFATVPLSCKMVIALHVCLLSKDVKINN